MDDNKGRRIFSLGLLLLFAQSYHYVPLASGQQGIFLRFGGEILPSDSFVDYDNTLNIGNIIPAPTNRNPDSGDAPGTALLCITDLEDCCGTESGTVRTVHGNWYFPDGTNVELASGASRFLVNRGPNEVINGQQFNGSVRLFRRFSGAPGRGRFRCELPNAANHSVNQILYVNILNFGSRFDQPHVLTSSTGSNMEGEMYSLMCSSTLNSDSDRDPDRLPVNVPAPRFVWSFGPSGSDPLPSGVTDMGTTSSDNITFTSTLQFSALSQCHIGSYTCRLGAGRLVTNIMITVNGVQPISVQITSSGAKVLGQNGYSLTCNVALDESLNFIIYQWTKNNGTQTQVGTDRVLSFSPLRLSDAGRYTCQATVSPCNIIIMNTEDVILQIPVPTVMLSSSIPNPIPPFGSNVTLTCAVELSPAVDVPVTVNTVLTTDEGFTRTRTAQPIMGRISSYSSTFRIRSFGRSNSGLYICRATVSLPSNAYISDSSSAVHSVRVTTGVYLALRGLHIANNSNINIRNISQSSDSPSGALQCITDNLRCCSQNPAHGEWYQPNGALVQGTTPTTAFYRTRGANGEVSLNRPSDVESPTGQFCCEVPDGTNTNQTLCVNIGGVSISNPSDPPIAGESYTLECLAGGSEGTFQWLKGPPDGRTPVVSSGSITISSTSTSSQLQFRPVQQSDNGSYSCSATTNGLTLSTESVMISVNAPTVLVQISGGVTPTAGERYQLTCNVSGAENLNPTTIYGWTRNSGSSQTQVGAKSILSFTPLRLINAASYVCEVTIHSSYITGDIAAMSINQQIISIQIPTPSSLMLTSNSGNPDEVTVVVGSDIILTCTLVLNSAIMGIENTLLMVEAQLSMNGTSLAIASRSITGTTFTYTTPLDSFGRNDSGNYTCTATIRPLPTAVYLTGNEILSSHINIRAVSAPPVDVQAIQSGSSAPVEVSWSPPSDGVNSINGYRIYYGNGQNVFVPSVTAITLVGLKVDGSYVDQNVSIRSESDQLYSELINVSVINSNSELCVPIMDKTMLSESCSCTSEIGIAVGAVTVVECVIVTVITVIVVLCLWRKKLSMKNKNNSSGNDFAVSANMAYGEVTLKPVAGGVDGGEYENPDKMLGTGASTYEPIHGSKPEASEYASVEDTMGTIN